MDKDENNQTITYTEQGQAKLKAYKLMESASWVLDEEVNNTGDMGFIANQLDLILARLARHIKKEHPEESAEHFDETE